MREVIAAGDDSPSSNGRPYIVLLAMLEPDHLQDVVELFAVVECR